MVFSYTSSDRGDRMLGLVATLAVGFGSAVMMGQFRRRVGPGQSRRELEDEVVGLEAKVDELTKRLNNLEAVAGPSAPTAIAMRLTGPEVVAQGGEVVHHHTHHTHSAVQFYGAYATLEQRSHVTETAGAGSHAGTPLLREVVEEDVSTRQQQHPALVSPSFRERDGEEEEGEEDGEEVDRENTVNGSEDELGAQVNTSCKTDTVGEGHSRGEVLVAPAPPPSLENLRRLLTYTKEKSMRSKSLGPGVPDCSPAKAKDAKVTERRRTPLSDL